MEVYDQNGNRCYNNVPCPETWLAESILSTIFCCVPFGIVGIVYAAQVSSNYHAGRYEEAERASKNAGKWTKISFFCGLAFYLIYILIYAIAGVSILSLAALDY